MQDEMNRLFGRWGLNAPRGGFPLLNLWEDENAVYAEAELPGFELGDLEVLVTGEDQMSLKGERKKPEVEGGRWHRQERGFGSFSRLVELPCPVDSAQVTAEFKDGVLTVKLPKRAELKPRRIEVKAN
jgi:HSP20 family protein